MKQINLEIWGNNYLTGGHRTGGIFLEFLNKSVLSRSFNHINKEFFFLLSSCNYLFFA